MPLYNSEPVAGFHSHRGKLVFGIVLRNEVEAEWDTIGRSEIAEWKAIVRFLGHQTIGQRKSIGRKVYGV